MEYNVANCIDCGKRSENTDWMFIDDYFIIPLPFGDSMDFLQVLDQYSRMVQLLGWQLYCHPYLTGFQGVTVQLSPQRLNHANTRFQTPERECTVL